MKSDVLEKKTWKYNTTREKKKFEERRENKYSNWGVTTQSFSYKMIKAAIGGKVWN